MVAFLPIYLFLFIAVLGNASNPEVKIKQGTLRGKYLKSLRNRTFSAFTAIPYAEPPIGNLRFKVAQPAGRWNGILNATILHSVCPQSNIFGDGSVTGDEDCLYLNAYTPQLKFSGTKLLPVMVFFHGGAFLLGNANHNQYDPCMLLDKDIVLVIPNYRLGPLGFLSTGDEVVPGNNGLKDQNLAIQWTKQNIFYFGGNPESITVFGQSAGGSSAHFHMLSPMSRDLIKGVISQSGTALSLWALAPNDQGLRNSKKLAQFFNCSIKSSYEMVECLRKVDAYEITRRQDIFYKWDMDPMTPFKPVIEPNVKGSFLPQHPIDIIKSGKAAKVPFITGITTEDGAMKSPAIFGEPRLLVEFDRDFNRIAPITLMYDETAPDKDYVTKKIREFYFGNRTIDNSSRTEVTNMYTDGMFLSAVNDVIRLHINYTNEPVYYYAFGYRGNVSISEYFGDPYHNYGVCHADELLYLFSPRPIFPSHEPSAIDNNITEVLTTLWSNFATTGNPTPTTNSIISTKWKTIQSENLEYYYIKNVTDLRMAEKLYFERGEFWKNLPVKSKNSGGMANTVNIQYILLFIFYILFILY